MNPKPDPTFVLDDPIVAPIAQMSLDFKGIQEMLQWLEKTNPNCLPDADPIAGNALSNPDLLFPHAGLRLTAPSETEEGPGYFSSRLSGNELLVELAGRKCYNSFGKKAGRKSNEEYIRHTQDGDIPHASIMYHAKMSFFVAGISRRVSHELIRHYVGADRDEEGSPSQESTRYVEHNGRYVAHPGLLGDPPALNFWKTAMRDNRRQYLDYIDFRTKRYREENDGNDPKGMDRKRIFETASGFLSHSAETSFVWTTNPVALAKLIRERKHEAADLEFQRLARVWRAVALKHWPNLFPQRWMKTTKSSKVFKK